MTRFSPIQTLIPLFLGLLAAGCGGGGGGGDTTPIASDSVVVQPPAPATGTVGLLITDKPTDELAEINVDIAKATLIGSPGQQVVFSGSIRVNLLDLANFNQPLAFGRVEAGTYNKLRLQLTNLELVDHDGNVFNPPLPANGKIDLLDKNGITVAPGRTLLADIDFDANKSIKVQGNGKNRYRMRPVVKVKFHDGGLPNKLARLEGTIAEVIDPIPGRILLCASDNADACMVVNLAEDGCVLDADGMVSSFDSLAVGDPVTVIGGYRHDDDGDSDSDSDVDSDMDSDGDSDSDSDVANADSNVELDATIIAAGFTSQVRGTVNGTVTDDGSFVLLNRDGTVVRVELQADCTRILGANGEPLTADALQLGVGVEIDGVIIEPDVDGEPTILRAALIFIDNGDEAEQLNGTVIEPITEPDFVLSAAAGDICVTVLEGATITVLSSDGTEMTAGAFADIVLDRSVEVYGSLGELGCFEANEVLVQLPSST